jgi:hypothetical protein
LIAEQARANSVASGGDKKSEAARSDSQNSVEPMSPVRTDEALADLAGCRSVHVPSFREASFCRLKIEPTINAIVTCCFF